MFCLGSVGQCQHHLGCTKLTKPTTQGQPRLWLSAKTHRKFTLRDSLYTSEARLRWDQGGTEILRMEEVLRELTREHKLHNTYIGTWDL